MSRKAASGCCDGGVVETKVTCTYSLTSHSEAVSETQPRSGQKEHASEQDDCDDSDTLDHRVASVRNDVPDIPFPTEARCASETQKRREDE